MDPHEDSIGAVAVLRPAPRCRRCGHVPGPPIRLPDGAVVVHATCLEDCPCRSIGDCDIDPIDYAIWIAETDWFDPPIDTPAIYSVPSDPRRFQLLQHPDDQPVESMIVLQAAGPWLPGDARQRIEDRRNKCWCKRPLMKALHDDRRALWLVCPAAVNPGHFEMCLEAEPFL